MTWWKPREQHQPQAEAVFRRMANAAFPGGDDQIAQETAELLASYPELDPSDARATHDLQVPFAVARRLGEVGLLRDPPGLMQSRRKSLSDALRRLQEI